MDLIILLCLVIFITYIMICCILAYYFIWHRSIWNQCFNTNFTEFPEYIECPKHSIFWIPNIIPTSENCNSCKVESIENAYFTIQLETLGKLYTLFKGIDSSILNNLKIGYNEYKMFMWLIEGSIKDYEIIKNESNDVYYKLKDTYTLECKHTGNTHTAVHTINKNSEYCLETHHNVNIESIPYLENNNEIFNNIITLLMEYINQSQHSNTFYYLIALFTDVLEYSRISRIIILNIINMA
jgi:hypothetical protein